VRWLSFTLLILVLAPAHGQPVWIEGAGSVLGYRFARGRMGGVLFGESNSD